MTQADLHLEHRAIIHLAWWRSGTERRLVFGWVEQLPSCFPEQRGHPFRSMPTRKSTVDTFHVARFPTSFSAASAWFNAATSGDLRLPIHPDKRTAGDSEPLLDPPDRCEPADGGESAAMHLPFLPLVHGPVFIRGLFGRKQEDLWERIVENPAAQWLTENIFIDFRRFPEFIGSLHIVRYHPVLRSVNSRLSKEGTAERELVRFTRWPGSNLQGLRLLAVEKRVLGLGKPRDIPVSSPLVEIDWGGKSDRTAIAVLHPEYGVSWWREPLPFLRTLALEVGLVAERRRVVIATDKAGRPTRHYDVDMVNYGRPPAPLVLVGEEGDAGSPAAREAQGEARRRELAVAASLGLRWFDEPDKAEEEIRTLIGRARRTVMIVDPYLGPTEVVSYGLAISNVKVDVELVTSAKRMRDAADPPWNTAATAMEAVLQRISANKMATIQVRVMLGQTASLHDRFIVVDGRVWLSGNSLNAVGSRASVLIEVPNPQDILSHLRPLIRAAQPFDAWMTDRRRSQSGRQTDC